jgi:hypothetical protein
MKLEEKIIVDTIELMPEHLRKKFFRLIFTDKMKKFIKEEADKIREERNDRRTKSKQKD